MSRFKTQKKRKKNAYIIGKNLEVVHIWYQSPKIQPCSLMGALRFLFFLVYVICIQIKGLTAL